MGLWENVTTANYYCWDIGREYNKFITVGVWEVKLLIDEIAHLINVPVYGYGFLSL